MTGPEGNQMPSRAASPTRHRDPGWVIRPVCNVPVVEAAKAHLKPSGNHQLHLADGGEPIAGMLDEATIKACSPKHHQGAGPSPRRAGVRGWAIAPGPI